MKLILIIIVFILNIVSGFILSSCYGGRSYSGSPTFRPWTPSEIRSGSSISGHPSPVSSLPSSVLARNPSSGSCGGYTTPVYSLLPSVPYIPSFVSPLSQSQGNNHAIIIPSVKPGPNYIYKNNQYQGTAWGWGGGSNLTTFFPANGGHISSCITFGNVVSCY